MKIKLRKNLLVAFAEAGDNEGRSQVGDSLGHININTGKFVGNTCCLIPLNEALDKINEKKEDKLQVLVDKVIERIKQDVNEQDFTAIDELLKFVPEENLRGFLSEN